MSRFPWLTKKTVGGVIAAGLLAVGVAGWIEQTTLRAWLYVRQLATADEKSRDAWAERVAGLGEEAVPRLLNCLSSPDTARCQNAQLGLARMTQQWGIGDRRTVNLAMRCGREFGQLSSAGQQGVLDLAADWFRNAKPETPPADGLLPACVRILAEASSSTDANTQVKALELGAVLLDQPQGMEALSAGRELVRHCLSSESADNRVRAVQLSLHAGMDLHEQVAALLSDADPAVRRAVLTAVGSAKDAAGNYFVLDDVLLPCLHDADADVRRQCEKVLRMDRRRSPQEIRLCFYLTAADPVQRIHVIEQLRRVVEAETEAEEADPAWSRAMKTSVVDPAVWLARISHDPSPAIRAAAVRMMSELNMTERLQEMARSDPSATVCVLAKFYLENPPRRDATGN